VNTTEQRREHTGVKPTIVLVHGAFADASSWNGVIGRLQQQGYTVIAPANPLRGVAADSAYTASTALVQYTYPAGPGGQTAAESAVSAARLREAFAADLPEPQAVTDHILKAAQAVAGAHP
jgi:pimeloyl-ACP methyl ester carboxylesterase